MAFELVLDPVVPQLGRDPIEMSGRVLLHQLKQAVLEVQRERELEGRGSQSSNKMPGRRKRNERRKKQMPESSSSTSSRRDVGVRHQGMHDRVEFEEEVTTEYVQRADVLTTKTVVSDTLRAEPLNSVHSKEVAGYLEEMNRLIEEKVIMEEEIILKNGTPAMNMYSDRTHLYIIPTGKCWPHWGENRHRYVRRLGCTPWNPGLLLTSADGQVCHEERVEQTRSTDTTVKNSTCLLFYVPPDFEL